MFEGLLQLGHLFTIFVIIFVAVAIFRFPSFLWKKSPKQQKKKLYKRTGWICLGLMILCVAGNSIVKGYIVDVIATVSFIGAIGFFVAAARIKEGNNGVAS